jgi:hypothetical protein
MGLNGHYFDAEGALTLLVTAGTRIILGLTDYAEGALTLVVTAGTRIILGLTDYAEGGANA